MAEKKISIRLVSGFDPHGVSQASKAISDFDKKLAETDKWLMQINAELSKKIHNLAEIIATDYGAAADKSAKGLGHVYETLEQINNRIDAPRKAAKAQEEMNRALARYCELCEQARRREIARLNAMRNPKSQWNHDPLAGILAPKDSGNKGGEAAANTISQVGTSAKSAVSSIMAMNAMLGSLDSSLGRVGKGIVSVISAFRAFGPVGVAVSAVMLAIQAGLNAYQEAQEKACNKIMEWAERTRERLAAIRGNIFDNMVRGLENVAKAADRASESFERAARRRENLSRKREGLNAARGEAELQNLRRQMADDVENADDANKGRVEAAWQLQIAEKEAELRERAAKVASESEHESLETARKRLALAESNQEKLSAAASKAQDEYNRIREVIIANKGKHEGEQDPEVQRYKNAYEAAERRAREAATRVGDLRVDLENAEGESEVNAANRVNDIAKARDAVDAAAYAYAKSEKDYANAQIEGERKVAAERERLDTQEAARRERERQKELADKIRDHQKLLAAERQAEESKAHSSVSAAESKLQQAWSWYRDKDSMAAQLQEEKANAEAEKQYEKDFEKLRWKHRDWRKAENLSVDEEAVRRVAIAREEKEAAEKHLAEIEKNTAELAAKLDELLQVK